MFTKESDVDTFVKFNIDLIRSFNIKKKIIDSYKITEKDTLISDESQCNTMN
jgi:hypothetical protein